MFKNISLLLIRILDRIVAQKKCVVFKAGDGKKIALVSYVLIPPIYIPFYYNVAHNNRLQCCLLVKALNELGYTVYLYDYLQSISQDIKVDLFIGHNKTFATLRNQINPKKSVLIVTGSHPDFGNQQQRERIADVNSRKSANLQVYQDNIVPDLNENFKVADTVLILGNEFVKDTYGAEHHHKFKLINNVTNHPYFHVTAKGNRNFLFISSVGQVHRGLDLLLDIFPSLGKKLYVLSSFHSEPDFKNLYQKELFQTENIIPVGYLDLQSKYFREILQDVDFVILPSCSEGQSSSVVNLMAYGLIPIVPQNVGIPLIEEIGIEIVKIDMSGVQNAIESALLLTDAELQSAKEKVLNSFHMYSRETFKQRIKECIQETNNETYN